MPDKVQIVLHCGDCGVPLDSMFFKDLADLKASITTDPENLRNVPERCTTCTKRQLRALPNHIRLVPPVLFLVKK